MNASKALHTQLLEQAKALAECTVPGREEADARRSVSTSYYALFHLLIHESASVISSAQGLGKHRTVISRLYEHSVMCEAANQYASGNRPKHFCAPGEDAMGKITGATKSVADAFRILQRARHDSDYAVGEGVDVTRAKMMSELAEKAFKYAREAAQNDLDNWNEFLLSLLIGSKPLGRVLESRGTVKTADGSSEGAGTVANVAGTKKRGA